MKFEIIEVVMFYSFMAFSISMIFLHDSSGASMGWVLFNFFSWMIFGILVMGYLTLLKDKLVK